MSEMGDKLDRLKIDRLEQSTGSRWWIPVAAIGVLILAFLAWWLSRSSVPQIVTVVAREVRAGDDQTVLNASGYVTARRQATVSSKITGKVLEVLIEEGMEVTASQVLARLDSSNASAAVRLAEAQLGATRTELEETRVREAPGRGSGGESSGAGRSEGRGGFAHCKARQSTTGGNCGRAGSSGCPTGPR